MLRRRHRRHQSIGRGLRDPRAGCVHYAIAIAAIAARGSGASSRAVAATTVALATAASSTVAVIA